MDRELMGLLQEYNPTSDGITEHTRLYHDLNIYGDDAEEVMTKFSEMFDVDLSEFSFMDHFPDEGDQILPEFCIF